MRDRSVDIPTALDISHCRRPLQPGQPCVKCCQRLHPQRHFIPRRKRSTAATSCRWLPPPIDTSIFLQPTTST